MGFAYLAGMKYRLEIVKAMDGRERIIKTINFQKTDRLAAHAMFSAGKMKEFKNHYGSNEIEDILPIDARWLAPGSITKAYLYEKYYTDEQKALTGFGISDWGVARIRSEQSKYEKIISPLMTADVDQIINYPYPEPDQFDWKLLKSAVIKCRDMKIASAGIIPSLGGTIWDPAWHLRGLEKFLEDVAFESEEFKVILEKVAETSCNLAVCTVKTGIDIIILADDVGTQNGMFVDPRSWRKWIKPLLKQVIDASRGADDKVYILYHSDGNIMPIINDLIEIGIDILNPIQEECMDIKEVQKITKDRVAVWGTIGTQTTMPFAKPNQFKDLVCKRLELFGTDGGLILAPTHILEDDVPWENIEKLFEAVEYFTDQ